MIAEPSLIVVGRRAEPGEDADAVRSPRLGGPGRVVPEALGLLRERDRLERARSRRRVAHVEAEAHRKCDANARDRSPTSVRPTRCSSSAPATGRSWRSTSTRTKRALGREDDEADALTSSGCAQLAKEQGLWAPHLPPEAGGSSGSFLVVRAPERGDRALASGRSSSSAVRRRMPGTARSCGTSGRTSRRSAGCGRSSRARCARSSR